LNAPPTAAAAATPDLEVRSLVKRFANHLAVDEVSFSVLRGSFFSILGPSGCGNRITVPLSLRTYAGLQRDCVVVGANTRLEIWDTQAWETYEAAQEAAAEEVLPGVL
jgi:ABC-type transporter Mla maintaining outer membrane lipid asymmetry ATPase subunit MlaF